MVRVRQFVFQRLCPAVLALLLAGCSDSDSGGAPLCNPELQDCSAPLSATECQHDAWRCQGDVLSWCARGFWQTVSDCGAGGQRCEAAPEGSGVPQCSGPSACPAGTARCNGHDLEACDGTSWQLVETCAQCSEVGGSRCVVSTLCILPGEQRCAGTVIEECRDNIWVPLQDCEERAQICEQPGDFEHIVRCAAPVIGAELDPCQPDAANCEPGLGCVAPNDSADALCFRGCDPAAAETCGADATCEDVAGAPEGGLCFDASAQRDDLCEDNGYACAAGAGVCTRTDTSPDVHRCKLRCDSPDIGQQGGCPETERCLASRFFYSQSPQVNCEYRGQPGVCDEAAGYWCDDVSGTTKCVRYQGWCGVHQPLLGAFSDEERAAYAAAGHYCNDDDHHQMCGIRGATGIPADVSCRDLGTHGGRRVNACVAFCSPDRAGDPDLDCGTGYACGRPHRDETPYFAIARDASGDQILCDPANNDAECDVAAGYHCQGPFGDDHKCAIPSKLCLAQ